jgi:hypothetical protein
MSDRAPRTEHLARVTARAQPSFAFGDALLGALRVGDVRALLDEYKLLLAYAEHTRALLAPFQR